MRSTVKPEDVCGVQLDRLDRTKVDSVLKSTSWSAISYLPARPCYAREEEFAVVSGRNTFAACTSTCSISSSYLFTKICLRHFRAFYRRPQFLITNPSFGLLKKSTGKNCHSVTRSMPSSTFPNTTCLPSSQGVGRVVMKNCDPLVLGPAKVR